MSCHLKTSGRIQGVSELRTFFFPHLAKQEEKSGQEDDGDGWGDDDWGWEATENKVWPITEVDVRTYSGIDLVQRGERRFILS